MRAQHIVAIVGLALHAAGLGAQPDAAAQLEFSTYFGGAAADTVSAVCVDADGNIYLAGSTRSSDLPTHGSLYPPPTTTGATVGFLTKLRSDRSIVYSHYLERPVVALAVDASGNAIVADNLSAGNKFSGPTGDVVVSKIDANGLAVMYSVRLAGSRLDQVTAIAVDPTGAVVVTGYTKSPDFPLLNPLQPTVHASGSAAPGSAFITKLDAQGRMLFSTGWGGSGEDAATGVAIDRSLDIVVAGTTASTDFTTTDRAFQRTLASTSCSYSVPCRDAFIARVSPDGQAVRYSTLFGGTNGETVDAFAIDHLGSPHIAGVTASSDLPLRGALQAACDSPRLVNGCSTYVTKLSPDGSSLQYSTYFGSLSYYVYGPGQVIKGLAVDPNGDLVAVGTTQGNDLPLLRAFQSVNGSGPLFKSTDDGVTWSPSSHGMAGTGVWFMASGGRRSPLYAAPLGGQVFRSEDHAGSWRPPRQRGLPDASTEFAVDSLTPSILYAVSFGRFVKSTDGGETWSDVALGERNVVAVAVAPSSPSNVYVSAERGVFHSPNGGLTWSLILNTSENGSAPLSSAQALAVHPQDADAVYAMFNDRRILRRDGEQQWSPIGSLDCPANQLLFARGAPSTMYARACGKVWKSGDDGRSWREVGFADRTAAWMALDPSMPDAVYVASAHNGVHRSMDRGETWTMIRPPLDQDVRSILVDPASPETIYIGATAASNGFVARFNPSSALTFSSYVGGLHAVGSAIAVDRQGAIVVGGTAGREFPLVQPIQRRYGGTGDGFLARITLPR